MKMQKNDLKATIMDIKIPDEMEQRLIKNCISKKKRGNFNYRKPVFAAVACMLVVIMSFGIPYFTKSPTTGNIELIMGNSPLIVRAYAVGGHEEMVFEDMSLGTEILMGQYSIAMSIVPGFPFKFSYPHTTIELSVDNGEFILWDIEAGGGIIERMGNSHSINGEGYILWQPFTLDSGPDLVETAIIDYRIIENGHVVGMGIIKIDSKKWLYSAELLLCSGFPKVEGQYQKVTAEKVQKIREQTLKAYNAN